MDDILSINSVKLFAMKLTMDGLSPFGGAVVIPILMEIHNDKITMPSMLDKIAEDIKKDPAIQQYQTMNNLNLKFGTIELSPKEAIEILNGKFINPI